MMAVKAIAYLFLVFLIVFSCFLFSFEAKAQGKIDTAAEANVEKEDNPFLDRDEELDYEDEPENTIGDMELSAVFYSPTGSRAVIDGRIVKLGDIIDNKEVIEIKSEKVLFRDFLGKGYVLEMTNILSAGDSDKAEDEFEDLSGEPGPGGPIY